MDEAAVMGVRTGTVFVLAVALCVYVLHEGAALFAPLFVGVLLAYAIEPLVELMMRARLSRFAAAVVAYLLFAILVGSLARTMVRHVESFVADLPAAVADVGRLFPADTNEPSSSIARAKAAAMALSETFGRHDAGRAPNAVRVAPVPHRVDVGLYVRTWGTTAALAGGRALLIGLLAFLMLCTGDAYKRKLVSVCGTRFAAHRLTVEVIRAIDLQIQRYLLVRLLISLIVAVATGVGLWLTGLSYPFVWGAVAGVLNVLPFVGPSVAVALITGAAFLQFKTAAPTLIACVVSGAVAAVEGNLITPALTSRAGDINTVAVFLSVLFWGWLWGVWGLVLAVPITVAIKAAADHIEPLQPVGELLGR